MDSAAVRGATLYQRLALATLGLLALAAWLLQHPFSNITHDSLIYTLFALARLHPATLGRDVLLRFGSQDRFTIFTPIYTAAIQLLGLQHAAALLVLLSHAALFVCAGLLARRFMSRLDATLGLALLAAIPSDYGSGQTFHFLETFMTPRLPAEALAVGAVLAAVNARYWIAAGCVAAAMVLHPIMGAAGAAFLIVTFVVPLRPRLTLTAAAVAFTVVLGIVLATPLLARLSDPSWMRAIVVNAPYLFVTSWALEDWSRAVTPLAVLAIGWRVGATPLLRRVCAGALAMVACGILITLVFADLLHVLLFLTVQAWRWLWLADVLALVLAPAILQDCWQRSDSGRVAVMTLAIAWVFRGIAADLLATGAALALVVAPVEWGQRKHWHLLFTGVAVLLGLAIILTLIDRFTYLPVGNPDRDVLLQEVREACSDGVILGTVSCLAWAALRRSMGTANPRLAFTTVLIAALFCIGLIPSGWRNYAIADYTPELASRFTPWRAEIPRDAEVLWPDTALAAWYFLERPNYWSVQQAAPGIFSRELALVMDRRAQSVRTALLNSNLLPLNGSREEVAKERETMLPPNVSHMDLEAMTAICADPDLQYIVSRARLTHSPFPAVTVDPAKANGKLYLYRCADLRP